MTKGGRGGQSVADNCLKRGEGDPNPTRAESLTDSTEELQERENRSLV